MKRKLNKSEAALINFLRVKEKELDKEASKLIESDSQNYRILAGCMAFASGYIASSIDAIEAGEYLNEKFQRETEDEAGTN